MDLAPLGQRASSRRRMELAICRKASSPGRMEPAIYRKASSPGQMELAIGQRPAPRAKWSWPFVERPAPRAKWSWPFVERPAPRAEWSQPFTERPAPRAEWSWPSAKGQLLRLTGRGLLPGGGCVFSRFSRSQALLGNTGGRSSASRIGSRASGVPVPKQSLGTGKKHRERHVSRVDKLRASTDTRREDTHSGGCARRSTLQPSPLPLQPWVVGRYFIEKKHRKRRVRPGKT